MFQKGHSCSWHAAALTKVGAFTGCMALAGLEAGARRVVAVDDFRDDAASEALFRQHCAEVRGSSLVLYG